jgi:hypothetical protein
LLPVRQLLLECCKFLFAAVKLRSLLQEQLFCRLMFTLQVFQFGVFFLQKISRDSIFRSLFIKPSLHVQLLSPRLLKFIKDSGDCGFRLLQFLFPLSQAGLGFGCKFCDPGGFGGADGVLRRQAGL